MVFAAQGQSLFKAATVEAHHKVNVSIFRECTERSSVFVYHDCQSEASELALQTRFESVDVAKIHLSFKPFVCLLLNICEEEQLLNL